MTDQLVQPIAEHAVPGKPLGRHVQHDPRSRGFAAAPRVRRLRSVRHTCHIGILRQHVGSCTGNSATSALACTPFWDTLPPAVRSGLSQPYADQVYSDATRIDPFPGEWPPTDTGSSGLAVAKILHTRGLISGYTHAFDVDTALRALCEAPVLIGVSWWSSFDTPAADGRVTITKGAYERGGHEVVLDQIDARRRRVWFRNSWGPGWGVEGRAYMTFATLERLLRENGDATVMVPLTAPAPKASAQPWTGKASTTWQRILGAVLGLIRRKPGTI